MKKFRFFRQTDEAGQYEVHVLKASDVVTGLRSDTYTGYGQKQDGCQLGDFVTIPDLTTAYNLTTWRAEFKALEKGRKKDAVKVRVPFIGDFILQSEVSSEEWNFLTNELSLPVEGEVVTYYTYWDGSNWTSIILDDPYYENEYEEITAPEEVARYNRILREMINDYEASGKGVSVWTKGKRWRIENSHWQGTPWIYTIIDVRGMQGIYPEY